MGDDRRKTSLVPLYERGRLKREIKRFGFPLSRE
jgi:hypothetical protein